MYCINQAALKNISYFAPVSACGHFGTNMRVVGFAYLMV